MGPVTQIVLTSLLSSVATAALLYVLFLKKMLPAIEARLSARLASSREEFVQAVERSVRRGLLDGVAASLPSREVLQDTTRTIARTGMEMMGDSLSAWLGGGRRGRRRDDTGGPEDDKS